MPPTTRFTPQEWLTHITQDDQAAFAQLYHHYRQKIYALACHLTESTVYAEEIVQDVFLKIWLKRKDLSEIDRFESYLFVIARNHIYTYLKTMGQQNAAISSEDVYILVDGDTPEARFLYKERALLLARAIKRLPPQQYEIYCLSKEECLTREQIAARLNLSPETVKVHLSRAMRSIRAYLVARMPLLLWLAIESFLRSK